MNTSERIIHALAGHGWTIDPKRAQHASKDFQTAVGTKTATAMCHPLQPDGRCQLSGSYTSEGRNVLDTDTVYLGPESTDAQIAECVAQFATAAECAIEQSYAVNLHREHGVRPRGG